MTEAPVFRTLQVETVQNGFIASTSRHPGFERGYHPRTYVFPTIAELSAWLVQQKWQLTGDGDGE